MYRSLLPATRVTAFYNAIFYGILPSSTNPRSDLKALGLDPDYVRYSGTLAWSEGTGVANGYLLNALQEKVNSLGMILFYLQRPEWSWRHVETMLPTYLSLRPEFCGNFDRSAGRPPGARSEAYCHLEPLSRARASTNRYPSPGSLSSGDRWRRLDADSQKKSVGYCQALDRAGNLPFGMLPGSLRLCGLRRRLRQYQAPVHVQPAVGYLSGVWICCRCSLPDGATSADGSGSSPGRT